MKRAVLALWLVAAGACASGAPDDDDGRPHAVTSVAPITNVVRNVAGDAVRVTGIVPEGRDSHTFEPAPRDARLLVSADLVLLNGLHLEEPTERLARANVRKGVRIVKLGDRVLPRAKWVFDFSFPEDKGDPNPHVWMDPVHAAGFARIAAGELARIDAGHAGEYRRRAAAFAERVEVLDAAIQEASATLPAQRRKLLTYHDSFAYFAQRYGYTVIGAIQPADFSEPSPQDVARLIEQIRRENVPAVFGSEVFPSPVLERIAGETGIQFVTTLRDDDLPGAPGAPEHTYLGMMVEDVRKIVTSLGGDARALDRVNVGNVE